MTTLITRDLILMTRRRGLLAAATLHVALLCGFLMAWGELSAVPLVPGANLYEQQLAVQWGFVVLAAPWVCARLVGSERRGTCADLSILTGSAPSRLLLARLAGVAACLLLLVGSGLPAVVLAQQMAGVPLAPALADQARLLLFAVAAAAVTLHVAAWSRGPLAGWLTGTLLALSGLTALAYVPAGSTGLTAAAIVLLAVSLAARADRTLIYREDSA